MGQRARVHRTSIVVLLLGAVIASVTFGFARSVRDENERRLLSLQADEMMGLVQSLAEQFRATVASVSVVAQRSGGDPSEFESFIAASQPPSGATWVLLHRGPDGITAKATVSPSGAAPALLANTTPDVRAVLDRAFDGSFQIVGMFGAGLGRSLGIASGVPGVPGDDIAYVEYPLATAAATPSAAADSPAGASLKDLYLALYLGDPQPENLVFQTADRAGGHQVTRSTQFGSQWISVVVAAKRPLNGDLASAMPWILFGIGVGGGIVLTIITELTLRRRDRAVAAAAELADKNHELDRAMAERDEADRAREALEEELRQSQRLEAVGRLAGGIAHDFNNLLAAILSYADLAVEDLEGHPSREDVEEIRRAARRGAALTRQLLLFSRHDRAQAEMLDVNGVVAELHRLFERTIGENVVLQIELGTDVPAVLVEAGEIEQVLMNLVVNARDVFDGSAGTIRIVTEGVDLPSPAMTLPPGLEPGRYLRIEVSDDGPGIAGDVLPHIFEPFFTTKSRGRGTGLGLSTVYGIVQRAGGHVAVRSSRGTGRHSRSCCPRQPVPPRPSRCRRRCTPRRYRIGPSSCCSSRTRMRCAERRAACWNGAATSCSPLPKGPRRSASTPAPTSTCSWPT